MRSSFDDGSPSRFSDGSLRTERTGQVLVRLLTGRCVLSKSFLRVTALVAFLLGSIHPCFAAIPAISSISPEGAISEQEIRITGTGFTAGSGLVNNMIVVFRRGSTTSRVSAVRGTSTELAVPLPNFSAGPIEVMVSNGVYTSAPFAYTIGSSRALATIRGLSPGSPVAAQNTYVLVDGLHGGFSGYYNKFEVTQGTNVYPLAGGVSVALGKRVQDSLSAAWSGVANLVGAAWDSVIGSVSTDLPGVIPLAIPGNGAADGAIVRMPTGLVPGPASIRAGYTLTPFSPTPTVTWGPSYSFTVADSPSFVQLVGFYSAEVCRGQNLAVLTDSPIESGAVGDSDGFLLEFSQDGTQIQIVARKLGRYLWGRVPSELAVGNATVTAVANFPSAQVRSNSLAFTIVNTPLRPAVAQINYRISRTAPDLSFPGYLNNCSGSCSFLDVPFASHPGYNAVRLRQDGTVYETSGHYDAGSGQLRFAVPAGMRAGLAVATALSTYGAFTADETVPVTVELVDPPVLTGASSVTASPDQWIWVYGSGFRSSSFSARLVSGSNSYSLGWANSDSEPSRASVRLPSSVPLGAYQLIVSNVAGDSAPLAITVSDTAAPLDIISAPLNVAIGQTVVVHFSGLRNDPYPDLYFRQGDSRWKLADGWYSTRLSGVIPSEAAPGPATLEVEYHDSLLATTRMDSVAVTVGPVSDPPIIVEVPLQPPFGTGQYLSAVLQNYSSSVVVQFTQGNVVAESTGSLSGDLVTFPIPILIGAGAASIRAKCVLTGGETAWSDPVAIYISSSPAAASQIQHTLDLFQNGLAIPGMQTTLTAYGIMPGNDVEVTLSGSGGVTSQIYEGTALGSLTFPFPWGLPAGQYLIVVRTRPSGVFSSFTGFSNPQYVEVAPRDFGPDLSISKTHDGYFPIGDDGIYRISVQNVGPGPTTGAISVTDDLPTGLTYISGTGTGWSCSATGQAVTCTYSSPLAAGATAALLQLTVRPGAGVSPSFTNTANVSTTGELYPANNSASDPTSVADVPDMVITKSHRGTFTVGSQGVYTITVQNEGTVAASNITVTDQLPAGLTFVSGTGTGWTITNEGGTVDADYATALEDGEEAPPIALVVQASASGTINNTAAVQATGEADLSDNSSQDSTVVYPSTVNGGSAARSLPTCYSPESAVGVSILATPGAGTLVYAVEDMPPAGWSVTNIGNGGIWDSANSKVKWGPFFDNTVRTLTYTATPPTGETVLADFSGTASLDGSNIGIGGPAVLSTCTGHPADSNVDLRMVIGEVTAYGAAWRSGAAWSLPPNPVPINYVTRAGYLWRLGELYLNNGETPPLCWVPAAGASMVTISLAAASATRYLPDGYSPYLPLAVFLDVTPDSATQAWAVEDTPPAGWTIAAINEGGQWDAVNGKVKWGPYFDQQARTLQYQATPPDGTSGTQEFVGTMSLDGTNQVVSGESQIGRNATTFSDVPTENIFYTYIDKILEQGITVGCGSGNFCPDSPVTRAQMAVFLLKAKHGSDYVPPAPTGLFADVPSGYWARSWIEQLANEGITAGCGPGLFCPENSVTRAQMAVFLLKAEHGSDYVPPAPTGVFADVPADHWAARWIERLASESITAGCGPSTFCPDNPVTRGQMAVFLSKTFGF